MYESHFGLNSRPYGEASTFLPLPSREAVLRRLRYGLEQGQGPALLYGAPGVGKTRLAEELARTLGGPSAHLTFPAMPAPELLAYLADELGAPADAAIGLAGSVRRVRSLLAAAVSRGERWLLIVDEAQLISDAATFEALRLLLNFTTAGAPDLSLLLVGGPEVLLALPEGLADRLTARCLLPPLNEAESAAYVVSRLVAARGAAETFDPASLAILYRTAEGMPRRLNRLADLCLLIAYAEGKQQVDAEIMVIAAREAMPPTLAA